MMLLYICETHFFTKQGELADSLLLLEQYKIDFVNVPNDTVTVQNQYKFGTMLNEVEYSRKIVTNGIGSAPCYY